MQGSGEDSGVDSRVGVENVDFFYGFLMIFEGSESKMLIFHWFFNDFCGVGVEHVDFSSVFQ